MNVPEDCGLCCYFVVMNRNYRIIEPEYNVKFKEELPNCLFQIKELEKERGEVFKLNIFVDSIDAEDFYSKRTVLSSDLYNFFKDRCPAFNILAQKPFSHSGILIEAGFIGKKECSIGYKEHKGRTYVVIQDLYHKGIWAGGLGHPSTTGNVEEDSKIAFREMIDLLKHEGISINNVIRQWNYIGEILRVEKVESEVVQNYQVFNEVRNLFYSRYRKVPGYPAATGIGSSFPGVSIDFYAIQEISDINNVAINNESQHNPYAYGQDVLVGTSILNQKVKQPPQFERSRLISTPRNATLFLSGTASIIGQETIGCGDLRKQIQTTIDNIRILGGSSRLGAYIDKERFASKRYGVLRVYVKNEEDFIEAKQICNKLHPNVPIAFVKADVCRDDLLIEIEGEEVYESVC
jgi:hypothetical protein